MTPRDLCKNKYKWLYTRIFWFIRGKWKVLCSRRFFFLKILPSLLTTYRPRNPLAPNTAATIPLNEDLPPLPLGRMEWWYVLACRWWDSATHVTGRSMPSGGRIKRIRVRVTWITEHSCSYTVQLEWPLPTWSVVAERSSLPDSSSGVSSRMWVRIPAVTLVSLSKTLNHNCFSPPRS